MGLSERELFRGYGVPYSLPITAHERDITVPFVTVSSGGTSDIPEDVYEVVLTKIADPKTVTAQRGPKAGEDIDLIDWTFAIASGPHRDKELVTSTSTASGPKSKMYAYLTALQGGRPPAIGQGFEKGDLIGRMALATVAIDDGGWARIANLSAIPAALLSRHVAEATGAPTSGTPVARPNAAPLNLQPAQAATAVADKPADGLPF